MFGICKLKNYSMIKRLWNYICRLYYTSSSDRYISYLRKKGIQIGEGSIIRNPHKFTLDISRPELIKIGKDVLLHSGTTILTHDFASRSFVNCYENFIPSHGKVIIGDNVWLGQNVSILKGVEIGSNVIIGYGSVVTKSIPSKSVAVGCPAKVICSFEEYYEKRKEQYVNECFEYAKAIYDSGRIPSVDDFKDDYVLFVDGHNCHEFNYPYSNVFNERQFEGWKQKHKAMYQGFNEFIQAVKERYAIP